jgi:hypothetical protein
MKCPIKADESAILRIPPFVILGEAKDLSYVYAPYVDAYRADESTKSPINRLLQGSGIVNVFDH